MIGALVDIDVAKAKAAFAKDPILLARAEAAAVNAAATSAAARLRNAVGKAKTLSKEVLRNRIRITQRAIPDDPTAVIASEGRSNRLDKFAVRTTPNLGRPRSPISVEVNVGDTRKIASGFFVPLRRGKVGGGNGFGIALRLTVMRKLGIRVGKGQASSANQRAPFAVLYGPSEAADLLKSWDTGQADRTGAQLEERLQARLAVALGA